jgi:hypothetical protein
MRAEQVISGLTGVEIYCRSTFDFSKLIALQQGFTEPFCIIKRRLF